MSEDDRMRVLVGRIVIEKYATPDDIEMHITGTDGLGDGLALVDALGMLAFAQHHTWDDVEVESDQ